jgi:hypothetical protein
MKVTTQLEQLFVVGLCVLAGLLLISFIRIFLLKRSLRRLDDERLKVESELAAQQQEVVTLRQDSQAWRTEIQRQFDAFRSDATRRYGEAELRTQDIQKRADNAAEKHERTVFELQTALEAARRMCVELPSAKARIMELEKLLQSAPAAPVAKPMPAAQLESIAAAAKSVATLPMLPSFEACNLPEPVDSTPTDELSQLQQRNNELQRALLLARRRQKSARNVRRK